MIDRITRESHRAVCKKEVRSAVMKTPIMVDRTRIITTPNLKMIRTNRTAKFVSADLFSDSQVSVRAAPRSPTPVPAATWCPDKTGRPLTNEERLTGAIADIAKADLRIQEKKTIPAGIVGSRNSNIRSLTR
jgi:hypothetical protein